MKTLTRNVFVKSLLLILVVAFMGSCKKDDGGGSGESDKGTFTIKGTTYSGLCQSVPATSGVSGNIDVLIADASGASFTVYNLPTGNSGTSTFVDFGDGDTAFSSELYSLCIISGSSLYYSTGGTVTKTGSSSYKFSANMINPTTNEQVTVTGSGKY